MLPYIAYMDPMGNLQLADQREVGILVALPVVHFLAADFAWELFKEPDAWRKTRAWHWFCRGLTMKIPRVGYA